MCIRFFVFVFCLNEFLCITGLQCLWRSEEDLTSLELKLQCFVTMWLLGTEHRFFSRSTSAMYREHVSGGVLRHKWASVSPSSPTAQRTLWKKERKDCRARVQGELEQNHVFSPWQDQGTQDLTVAELACTTPKPVNILAWGGGVMSPHHSLRPFWECLIARVGRVSPFKGMATGRLTLLQWMAPQPVWNPNLNCLLTGRYSCAVCFAYRFLQGVPGSF